MVRMALARTGRCAERPDKPIDLLSPCAVHRPRSRQICFQHRRPGSNRHLPKGQTVPPAISRRPARAHRLHLRLDRNVARPAFVYSLRSQPNHRTHGNHLFLRSFPASRTPTPANRRVQTTLSPAPSHRRQASRTGFAWLAQDPLCRKIKRRCSGSGWLPQ